MNKSLSPYSSPHPLNPPDAGGGKRTKLFIYRRTLAAWGNRNLKIPRDIEAKHPLTSPLKRGMRGGSRKGDARGHSRIYARGLLDENNLRGHPKTTSHFSGRMGNAHPT